MKHNHYFKPVPAGTTHVDVYRVLSMFSVTNPCIQHAVKKLLVAGGRGAGKDVTKDVQEAVDSLVRWQGMQQEDMGQKAAPESEHERKKPSELEQTPGWQIHPHILAINAAHNRIYDLLAAQGVEQAGVASLAAVKYLESAGPQLYRQLKEFEAGGAPEAPKPFTKGEPLWWTFPGEKPVLVSFIGYSNAYYSRVVTVELGDRWVAGARPLLATKYLSRTKPTED